MLQSFNRLFTNDNKNVDGFANDDVVQLPVANIVPNMYQPRTEFDEDKIRELAQTFKTHGIIQPIVVRRRDGDQFEVIAGERRLRAAKLLEWETISAIVRDLSDTETASVALIENIQREGLSVIEEAIAYEKLIDMHDLTQEALAQRLGKSQSTVANRIRLLALPDKIQQGLGTKQITERHARALMKLKDENLQLQFYKKIIDEQLTVRKTDEEIKRFLENMKQPKKVRNKPKFVSKDVRIATNTIKRSLKMIADTGIKVESEEQDLGDFYQIIIKVKKNK